MKKKTLIIILLLIGTLSTVTNVDAAEKKSYESNSGVGFYGKYENPNPEKPNQLVPPSSSQSGGTTNEGGQLNKLPQTGETNDSYLKLIGRGLFSIAVLLIIINKKKKTQEEFYYEIS